MDFWLSENSKDRETIGQRIVWAAGIHGIGTLGVVKCALANLAAYDWNQIGNACFLIQSAFSVPKGAVAAGGPHANTIFRHPY